MGAYARHDGDGVAQHGDHTSNLDLFLPEGYAMLMRPNKAEIAVQGCHCPGDMAVRMRKVLACSSVSLLLWLTETYSLGLLCTSLILDIHVMIN